jgi:4-amino-4-deoxy-L-arabinose transferase-like glycosyltransferase
LPQATPTRTLGSALRTRARHWGWPLAVIALGLGSALLWLPYLDMPLDFDVGVYATVAYWWARGDTLYQNITTDRPQAIFVIFRAIEALGLGSVRGLHVAGALYAALCALALLAVAARVWGRGVGLGAAALFALVMATPYLQGPTLNSELFMLLPILGSLLLLVRADDHPLGSRSGLWRLGLCGLLAALALLLKPPGVAALALAVLWLVRRWRTEGASRRAWLAAEAALAAGFVLGLLPALAHGLLTAPDRYLYAVLFYRLESHSVVGSSPVAQARHFALILLYVLARYPLLLLVPVGLWAAHRASPLPDRADRADRASARRGRDLLWLWLLTSFAGAALGGNWYPHYYQQLLPPFAVAVALAVRALLARPASAQVGPRLAWSGLRVLALGGVLALAYTVGTVVLLPPTPARLVIDPLLATLPTREIAAYLREHTTPDESVYVVYSQGEIYYRSERRPAARWLHLPELQRIPGAFDEQVARLADPATAPRYIVVVQPFDAGGLDADGALRAVVARDYTLETTIGGVPLYRRGE